MAGKSECRAGFSFRHDFDNYHLIGTENAAMSQYLLRAIARLPAYGARTLCALTIVAMASCTSLPSQAPEAAPTAMASGLIPVRDFVANRDSNFGYHLSPDGKKLAWIGVLGVSMHIFVKDLERNFTTTLPVGYLYADFSWAQDSRHLLSNFHEGDENWLVLRLDTASGEDKPRFQAVVAEKGVSALLVNQPVDDPEHVLVAHNRRDKTLFDLYRVHLRTGKQTLVAENPGDVKVWLTDRRGQWIGRIVRQDQNRALQLNGAAAPIYTWSAEDDGGFAGLHERGDRLYLLSNKGRDRVALLEIDAASGAEKVLHADPRVDVSGVLVDPVSGEPLLAYAEPDHVVATPLHPAMPKFAGRQPAPGHWVVISSDRDFRRLVVARVSDKGEAYFLHDEATGQTTRCIGRTG